MKSSKHMWQRCLSVLLVLVMVAAFILPNIHVSAADTDADLWVDPVNGSDTNDGATEATALKTIQAAKSIAASLSAESDVVVILKGGTYDASETIVFGAADSGKNGHTITYRAAAGEKALISGGASIDGWTLHDAEKNIYVADIPAGTELTRSFYVDGVVQTMAYMEQSPIDWEVLSSSGYRSPNVTSADNNEYLILDLGKDTLVSGLTLYAGAERAADGFAAGFPKDFTISTSTDGINWTVQVDETDCQAPIARSGKEFTFPAVGAHFVKLNVTKLGNATRTSAGQYHLALSEILVGLSTKQTKINNNIVQHLDMANPIAAVENLSIDTTYTANLGTAATAVGAIEIVAGAGLAGTMTSIKVEASVDGTNWTTVYNKDKFVFEASKVIAFNPVAATELRITTGETAAVSELKVYKPASLSTGANVTIASGKNAGKLTDGKFDGTYASGSYMTAIAGTSDIVINLGSVQDIGGVRLYPTYVDGKVAGYVEAARVLVSKDGENYTTVLEMSNITAPEFGAQLLLFAKGYKAQYVKIQPLLLTAAGSDYCLQLEELDVVPAKVEVDETLPDTITEYKTIYSLIPLTAATPTLGYYENVNNMDEIVAYQTEKNTTPGDEAKAIIDMKTNSYGYTGLFNYGDLVSYGGVKVPAFLVDLGAAATFNTIELAMDPDLWGVPFDFEIQVLENDTWKTIAEVTDAENDWTVRGNYAGHYEFEAVTAKAVRVLVYDLSKEDGAYPKAEIEQNPSIHSTRLILQELSLFNKEVIPYEIEVNQEADTVEYNKINLSTSNILGYGYYRPGLEVVTDYKADNGAKLFDGNKENYSSTNGQQYNWMPDGGGGNHPAILLDVSKSNNGLPVNINAIELTVREDGRCAPYDYMIQVTTSATEDNWITITEESAKDWAISNEAMYRFPNLEIYKLRLVATNLTPQTNIPMDSATGVLVTYMHVAELAVYNISDPTNPVADDLCTQGEDASGDMTHEVALIEAKHDNPDNVYNANKAIDGYLDPIKENGFIVPEKYDFKNLWHPEHVEMHTLYLWYHNVLHFTGVSGDGTEIFLETGLMPTWVANDYLFIDSVGEWYIDRETCKIYYKADGTMDGKEAILPVTEQIIQMDYASNIKFEGITFSHTTWTYPSENEYNDEQANTYLVGNRWIQVPAGVQLLGCTGIVFDDCTVTNMGTAGIKIKSDGDKTSDGNQIINSRFYDIGYSSIIVGDIPGHHGYQSYMLVKNTTIKNNYITRVGLENRDSPGIIAAYTNGTVIEHNEVAFCPYTGISTGWGWDSEEANGNQAFMDEVGNNKVIYNYVHDTGKNNRDGGSIYNLGSSKGSEVAYNYIFNSWDGDDVYENGLYLDQGSAFIEVHHNVVGENVGYWMHQWMSTIHDNIWHDNYYVETKSRDNGSNNQAYDNTKVDEQADLYDHPEAVEIMENAGLLDESVKDGVWEGFAQIHDIIQEFWPGENSRYIEPTWGWDDVTIAGQVGRTIYDSIKKRVNINVKEDTDITALALMFTLYDGWTSDKASGSIQDFSEPVVYTLTDGKTTVKWTVSVKKQVDSGGEIPGEEVDFAEIIAKHEAGQWSVEPARVANGVMHHSDYSGYIAQYFGGSTIFKFDVSMGLQSNSEIAAISLNNQDPSLDWDNGGTEYMINFNKDNIEVQKFVGGQRTVFFGEQANHVAVYGTLPNNFFTSDEVHSVKTGAINTDDGGVRLFMFVDGNLVFDFVDTEDPIRDGGYFAVHAGTQTISLRGFSGKEATPDTSELDWALYVVESLDFLDYKQETWGNLQSAVTTVNEILASYGGVTQEMVDKCTMILWDALDNLEQVDGTPGAIIPERPAEPGEVDWTEFNELNDLLYTLDLTQYSEESINALYEVIAAINEIIYSGEELTQEDIDAMTQMLADAIAALDYIGGELPPIDRPEGLDYTRIDAALVVALSAKEENYSAKSFAALQDAIKNAYEVMGNADCTQADVNAAYIALVDAIENLVYIGEGLQPIIPPIKVPGADEPGTDDPTVPGGDEPGTDDPTVPGGDQPDAPGEDDGNLPGKTGDDFALVGLIVLLAIGMAGAAAVVVLMKKNRAC